MVKIVEIISSLESRLTIHVRHLILTTDLTVNQGLTSLLLVTLIFINQLDRQMLLVATSTVPLTAHDFYTGAIVKSRVEPGGEGRP